MTMANGIMTHTHQGTLTSALILVVLLSAGCRSSNGDRTGSHNMDDLTGVEWRLVRMVASDTTVTRDDLARAVTLEFTLDDHEQSEGGKLATGYGPCNSFSVAYRTEGGGDISFDNVVSTYMACEEEIMMHEHLLFQGLQEATSYAVDDSSLQIRSEGITLTYESI